MNHQRGSFILSTRQGVVPITRVVTTEWDVQFTPPGYVIVIDFEPMQIRFQRTTRDISRPLRVVWWLVRK